MAAAAQYAGPLTKLACVVGGGLAAGLLVVKPGPAIGLFTVTAAGGMALLVLSDRLTRSFDDPEARARIQRWTMVSFAIHLALGLVIINTSAVYFFGPDATAYHGKAGQILDHWSHGATLPLLPAGKEGYYYLLASVYWLFGPFTWAGVALNAALAAALVPVVSDTAHRLFGSATVRYVPVILLLVPGMILWPSQLLKESPFLFLLAVAANCAARLVKRYSPWPLLLLVVLLPGLLTFRAQLSFAILTGLVAGLVFGRQKLVGGLIGGLVASVLVTGVVASGIGSGGYQTAVASNLERANEVRRGSATEAASGFVAEADISSADRALRFLPIGLVAVSVGPLPWQLSGGRQLVVIPDVFAWWVLVMGFWWGQRAARARGRHWLVLATPALAAMIVIALSIGNYGTMVRERMQILVLLAPVVALGLAERRDSRLPARPQAVDRTRPAPGRPELPRPSGAATLLSRSRS